jgi:VanZ family protein
MQKIFSILASVSPRPLAKAPAHTALRFLWVAAIVFITICSLLPNTSPAMQALSSLNLSDKFEHLCAYAFLAFLPALHERRRFTLLAALGAVLLGVFLEFAQLFSKSRTWELSDMGADALGVALGLLIGIPMRSIPFVRLLIRPRTR